MAVEGYSRVPLGQAGTGEAFVLGESRALDTYVQQEQAQIAAKQKADQEVKEWKPEEIGWVFEENVGNAFADYKQEVLNYMEQGKDLQSIDLKRKKQQIEDMARQSVAYTKRFDEIAKTDPKDLFGEDESKYYDKSVYMKNLSNRLTDGEGNILTPDKVKGIDLADTHDPDAFMTPLFVNDFVKDIKDQMSIQGNDLVNRGYGQYIVTEGNKVRFVNGVDENGQPIAGVNDQVGQLLLDHPIYNEVTSKKVQRDMDEMVAQKMAEGMSELDAKSLIYSNKDDLMMAYAKDDIGAYQQVEKTSDMKLGLNVGTTRAAIMNAEASKQRAATGARAEARKQQKQDSEITAASTTKASVIPTKIEAANGKTANLGAFGNIGVPKDKIAKKDGENGVKEGEPVPRSFSLNSVFNISSGGTTTKGTVLRVQGKESQAGTFAPIEGDYGQRQYQPKSIKKILVNEAGELVDIANVGKKTDAELAQVARDNNLQLLEAAEMKDMETGDIIYTPMEGNPERQNIYNYFNTDYERANQSLGEVEGISRYEKLDAQGTKDRSKQPKKIKTKSSWSSQSNNNSSSTVDSSLGSF